MKIISFRLFALIIIFQTAVLSNFAQEIKAKIIIGSNIHVSTDGNFAHEESMLAANPKDTNNLIAAAQVPLDKVLFNKGCKIYVTKNAGKSWKDISLPQQIQFGGGDPQVAFGLQGTAYFTALWDGMNLSFCRSEDGGTTWDKPINLSDNLYGSPKMFDYEKIIVDQTFGKFAGRIYISASTTENNNKFPGNKFFTGQYFVCLFRSDDDGKSFVGPMNLASSGEGNSLQVSNVLISSNGTLFFTYTESVIRIDSSYKGTDLYIISSEDGGVSFSQPAKVVNYKTITLPRFSIDNKSEKHRGRIYCVYIDGQTLQGKTLMFTHSEDEGRTWSDPKAVDPNTPKDAIQRQADITVNSQGVVGIRWYDTRGTEGKGYNEYFTASLDGGKTFLPPVKVSSSTSINYKWQGNSGVPTWKRINDSSLLFSFQPSFGAGDHYCMFTSDATGLFHDLWSDYRDGHANQLYTSTIKIVQPGDKDWNENIDAVTYLKKEKKNYDLNPKTKILENISKDILLQIEDINYDSTMNVLSIPVRIKNISDKPLYGPIKIEISKIDTSDNKHIIPVVLNSSNKKRGVGAAFTYALSKSSVLLPDEETETMIWKFKVKFPIGFNLESIADLNLKVKGLGVQE